MSDPNRHLRDLHSARAATLGRAGEAPAEGTASFLGVVAVETTLPTLPERVFVVHPASISGGDAEGGPATIAADATRSIPVVMLGDRAPALGDVVRAFAVGGRWVAETGCGTRAEPSDCPGGGTVCVTLGPACPFDADGYVVTVKARPGGESVASGTLASGTACVSVPPGTYDVVAARDGCATVAWEAVVVTCGETSGLGGTARCDTGAAVVFTVRGCGSLPLEGAVVTVAGEPSVTTGADGKAVVYTDGTGSLPYTVAHPSGRFVAASGSVSKSAHCTPAAVGVTLQPAAGYTCCLSAAFDPPSPTPVPTTLYITDGDGNTIEMAFQGGFTCLWVGCAMVEMDDCADLGPNPVYTCIGGGLGVMPPPIGRKETAANWSLNFDGTDLRLQQQAWVRYTGGGLTYVAGGDVSKICSPVDTRRNWRVVRDCSVDVNSFTNRRDVQSGFTVNSVDPLNVSFAFAPDQDFGPNTIADDTVSGGPYTLSANLHE